MATPWGAGRYTTAPGTAAASATTARRASRTGQTASKPIWAAPALRKEAATARSPAIVATPARGTTPRFTTTPIVESWLKWVRVIGRTASWAAALTANRAGDHAARHRRRYDAGGRGEGELKARVEQVTRADGEDRQRGEGEAVGDRSLPLAEQRRENEHRHEHGGQPPRPGPDAPRRGRAR